MFLNEKWNNPTYGANHPLNRPDKNIHPPKKKVQVDKQPWIGPPRDSEQSIRQRMWTAARNDAAFLA
jgi:hypothetical protein